MSLKFDSILRDLVRRGIPLNSKDIVEASFVKGVESMNILVTTYKRMPYDENYKKDENYFVYNKTHKKGYAVLYVSLEFCDERGRSVIKPFKTQAGNPSDHVSIATFIKKGFV